MSQSNLSPTARKVARILRNAKREAMQNAKVTCYENDSIEDSICYEFSSSVSYENDSGFERDFSIGLDC